MKNRQIVTIFVVMIVLLLSGGNVLAQEPEPPSPPLPLEKRAGAEAAPLQAEEISIGAALDHKIPIQGRLTDQSDIPINGQRNLTYRLYDASSGGSLLCQYPDYGVQFEEGLFNGIFDVSQCVDIFDGRQLYLGITVGNDSEMYPRRPLYPVPYALSLRPGAEIEGSIAASQVLRVVNTSSTGESKAIYGYASAGSGKTYGLYGKNDSSDGVGVYGRADAGGAPVGVYGRTSTTDGVGVYGYNSGNGIGVIGYSEDDIGTIGYSVDGVGLMAITRNGDNVFEAYDSNDRVFRVDENGDVFADSGYHCGENIYDGAGDLNESELSPCLDDNSSADFAEMWTAAGELEAGDLLAADPDGTLTRSSEAYQSTIVGVYSTRPSYLGNSRYRDQAGYVPLALVGIVPLKVTDENGPIQGGDLLVASSTPGHAMKAGPQPATGTVIGKALGQLEASSGVIQIVLMLQ